MGVTDGSDMNWLKELTITLIFNSRFVNQIRRRLIINELTSYQTLIVVLDCKFIILIQSFEQNHLSHHSNESFVFVNSPKMIHQVPEQNLLYPNRKIKLAFWIEKIYRGIQMKDLRSLNQALLDQDQPDEKGYQQRKIRVHFKLHPFIWGIDHQFLKMKILLCPSI